MVAAPNGANGFRKTIAYTNDVNAKDILEQLGIPYFPSEWTLRNLSSSLIPREPEIAPGPWHEIYVLVVSSIAEAREFLPLFTCEGVAKNLVLAIQYWGSGLALDLAKSPPVSAGQSLEVFTSRGSRSYRIIRIHGSGWSNIHAFASAIAGCAHNDARKLPLSGIRFGVDDHESALWAVGDALARWADHEDGGECTPDVDSVDLHARQLREPGTGGADFSIHVLPPVDSVIFSPSGFEAFPTNGTAKIVCDVSRGGLWQLVADEKKIGSAFGSLDENILAETRTFQGIRVDAAGSKNDWNVARMLTQLAVSGVPVVASSLGQDARLLLGPTLSNALGRDIKEDQEHSERESQSIDLRRIMLKQFLPRLKFADLGIGGARSAFDWPTVSVVLSTKRVRLIPQILKQIEIQSYQKIELILAIHGNATLSREIQAAIDSFERHLETLFVDDSVPFGDVLNQASFAASGELITKMDDDDWYSPMHIMDLVLGREYSGAELVGCPVEFSYLEGLDITTRRNHGGERFTDHIAGGTMLLSKQDLKQVGWWRSANSSVDRALIDAVRASGARVYRTHGQNYVMHRRPKGLGNQMHTWDADYSVFLRDIREQWDGFVLPPQFRTAFLEKSRFERSNEFLSIFSASDQ